MNNPSKISRIQDRIKKYYALDPSVIADHMFSSVKGKGDTLRRFKVLFSYLLIASVFKLLVFNVILNNVEFLYDRLFLISINTLIVYFLSKRREVTTSDRVWMSLFLGCYIVQVLFSAVINDFGELYILDFWLTILFVVPLASTTWWNDILIFILTFSIIPFESDLALRYDSSQITVVYIVTYVFFGIRLFRKYLLKESEGNGIYADFLREILTRSELAIFLTDFEGDIFDSNVQAEKMFGFSKEEIQTMNFSVLRKDQLTYEEDMSGLNEILHDRFWNADKILLRKGGVDFEAHVSISLIRRVDGNYLIYRVKDITDIKLTEKLLKDEKDKAEAAVLAKAQFLATMSHEIRTPMNGVLGMSRILSETNLNYDQKEYVDTILRSGASLVDIINDILDFSKIEAHKISLEQRPFNIHNLFTDIIKLYDPLTSDKNVNLSLKIGNGVPRFVVGDSLRLRQVINNLVNNAIKFTDHGHVHIIVERVGSDGDSWDLSFRVVDSGVGIPEEKKNMLFDSFSQVDASDSRRYGGTGLGLAICKGLVDLMEGVIHVKSEVGVGSEFSFTIKFGMNTGEIQDVSDEEVINQKLEKYNLSLLKVLLAEDNEINQKVAQIVLAGMGIEIDIAENGLEVLDACDNVDYDIILMDVQMPELDGIAATEELFRRGKVKEIPVILAMTANVMEEDRKKCFEAGMSGFIPKPLEIIDLKRALLNYLENSKHRTVKC